MSSKMQPSIYSCVCVCVCLLWQSCLTVTWPNICVSVSDSCRVIVVGSGKYSRSDLLYLVLVCFVIRNYIILIKQVEYGRKSSRISELANLTVSLESAASMKYRVSTLTTKLTTAYSSVKETLAVACISVHRWFISAAWRHSHYMPNGAQNLH